MAYLPLGKEQMRDINAYKEFTKRSLTERMQTQESVEIDVLGFLMAAGKKNPAYKLTDDGLASETQLVVAAGSDTTSIAIT